MTDAPTDPTPDAPPAPQATDQTTPPAQPGNDLPEWARDPAAAAKMVADLRAENARTRTSAKEAAKAEARDELLTQLGLKPKDEPVDPAQVARDLAQKDQVIRDLQVKSALGDALAQAGAKPIARAAILGDGLLNDLDPASATFASDVATRVADYVGKNPELKAGGQAPRRSGTDTPGGEQQKPTYTRAQLRNHDFYLANKADIDLAAAEGRIA